MYTFFPLECFFLQTIKIKIDDLLHMGGLGFKSRMTVTSSLDAFFRCLGVKMTKIALEDEKNFV